jgi:GNAT superfamily N-acetyltransferase
LGVDEHNDRLPDGTPVIVRPLRPEDAAELREGFDHLSSETRRRRFLTGLARLPANHIYSITHADNVEHLVWGIAVIDAEGHEHGVGVAHVVREREDRERAEFAVVIADEWQGRGAGRVLARALAARSYELGIRVWVAVMALDNFRVQRLLASVADEISRKSIGCGAGEVLYRLRPTPADRSGSSAAP